MSKIQAISAVVLPEKLKQIVVDHQNAKISNLSYMINDTTPIVWIPSEKHIFVGPDAIEYKGDTVEAALVAAKLLV